MRRASAEARPYWQEFAYEAAGRQSVSQVLAALNEREPLVDVAGKPAARIAWECGCLQQICGACSMRIDGRPALACNTFVDTGRARVLTVEPLRSFAVVEDLVVDRAPIFSALRAAGLYGAEPGGSEAAGSAAAARPPDATYDQRMRAAMCIKCGLCLEVCPNFSAGGSFVGAAGANDAFVLAKDPSNPERGRVRQAYERFFAAGCSKSRACEAVCPMQIPTLSSIAGMNRG